MKNAWLRSCLLVTLAAVACLGEAAAAPTTTCAITTPASPLVAEATTATVTFTPGGTGLGYAPAVEIYLPPGFSHSAITSNFGGMTVLATTSVPASLQVTNPYTGLLQAVPTGVTAGDQYVLATFPFSSLAPNAPPLVATVTANVDSAASLTIARTLKARCLYLAGATFANDPATDPPLSTASVATTSVTPAVVRISTSLSRTKTATGRNFPVSYTIDVKVAAGKAVSNLEVEQVLGDNLQLLAAPTIVAGNGTVLQPAVLPVTAGGTVKVRWASLLGTTAARQGSVRIDAFVPELDATGQRVLATAQSSRDIVTTPRIATFSQGATTSTNILSAPVTLTAQAVSLRQAFSVSDLKPGDFVTVTNTFDVSDYFSFNAAGVQNELVTTLAPGLTYDGAQAVSLVCSRETDPQSPTVSPAQPAPAGQSTTVRFSLPALTGSLVSPGTTCTLAYRVQALASYGLGGGALRGGDSLTIGQALKLVDGNSGLTSTSLATGSVPVRLPTVTKVLAAPSVGALGPGATAVWRLELNFAASSGGITLVDFLPAPFFDAAAGGTSGTVSLSGAIRFESSTTAVVRALPITWTADTTSNTITLDVPAFTATEAQKLVLLIDSTVSSRPWPDRAPSTNLVSADLRGTGTTVTNVPVVAAFTVNEPNVLVAHSVVASNNPNVTFSPAVPVYAQTSPSGANTYSDAAIAAAGLPKSSVSGIDVADTLTFATVAQNLGHQDALALTLSVTVPADYGVATQIALTDGSGTALPGATATFSGTTLSVSIPVLPAAGGAAGANVAVLRFDVAPPATTAQKQLADSVATLSRYLAVSGGPNFLTSSLTASTRATVASPAVTRTTTWAATADHAAGQATVGDIGTYVVSIRVPEGVLGNVIYDEVLPAGLALTGPPTVTLTGVTASGSTTPTVTASGGRFTLSLGTVANVDTNNGQAETIEISYGAVLLNSSSVQVGTALSNTAGTLSFTGGTSVISTQAPPLVTEPKPAVAIVSAPTSADAGDVVTYTVTVQHLTTPKSGANELTFTTTLPATLGVPSQATLAGGNTGCTAANAFTSSVTGQVLTVTCANLATADKLVFAFTATVAAGAPLGSSGVLATTTTWTSLPGSPGVLSPYNALARERTGNSTDPGGTENDYRVSTSVTVPFKNVTTGSALRDFATNGAKFRVGELVSHDVVLTIPEGSTTRTLVDTLPAGLDFVSASGFVNSAPGVITCSLGCDPSTLTPSVSGQTITWDFGTITNAGTDNNTRTLSFVVNARVSNIAANIAGASIARNSVTITGGTAAQSDRTLTVVEPAVTVTNSFFTPGTNVDAGDAVSYVLTLSNPVTANGATASDLVATVGLPPKFTPTVASVLATGCAATATLVSGSLVVTVPSLPMSGTNCVITVPGTLGADVSAGEVLTSTGSSTLTWTSMPGTVTGERNGTGGINNYLRTIPNASIFTKPLGLTHLLTTATTAAIGETVTFELGLSVPEGQTAVNLLDTLPEGLTYSTASVLNTNPTSVRCGAPAPANCAVTPTVSGQTVAFNFGTITVDPTGAAPSLLRITVSARVANAAGNVAGLPLGAASASINGGPPARATAPRVIEPTILPNLTVASSSGVDAGDGVVYTLSITNQTGPDASTAHDLAAHFDLPVGVTATASPLTFSGCTGSGTVGANGRAVDVTVTQLAPSGTPCVATLNATLDATVSAGQLLTSSATGAVTWTSLPGAVAGERTGAGGVNSYVASIPVAVVAVKPLALGNQLTSGAGAVIGALVTHEVTVAIPEGRSQVSFVLTLPDGLTFVSSDGSNSSPATMRCAAPAPTNCVATPSRSGQALTFDLGEVTVTPVGAPPPVMRFTILARVDNVSGNVAGVTLTPATLSVVGTAPVLASGLRILEPEVTPTLVAAPASEVDAGDSVNYTLSLANPVIGTGATAHDLVAHLELPPEVQATAGPLALSGCSGTAAIATGGRAIDLQISTLAQSATPCSVSFGATISATVAAGQILSPASASVLRWTSLPGVVEGERTGAGGVDSYSRRIATGSVQTKAVSVQATRLTGEVAAIGERVAYEVLVGVPEGVTPLRLTGTLPEGLRVGSITVTNNDPTRLVCGSPAPQNCVVPYVADGRLLTFDFGSATVAPVGGPPRTLRLVIEATLDNAIGFTAGRGLSPLLLGVEGGAQSLVLGPRVVEPALSHTTVSSVPAADAGDRLTLTTTLTAASGLNASTAHDVRLRHDLPATLAVQTGSLSVSAGCGAPANVVTQNLRSSGLDLSLTRMLPGATCVISYGVVVSEEVLFGSLGDFLPTSYVTWTSLAGESAGERTGADGSLGLPNNYALDTLTLALPLAQNASLAKAFVTGSSSSPLTADPSLAAGERAQYRVSVTLPEGVSQNVVVTDTPPPGLRITRVALDASRAFRGTLGLDPTRDVTTAAGEPVSLALGTVRIPGTQTGADRTVALLVNVEATTGSFPAPATNRVTLAVNGADVTDVAGSAPVAFVRPSPRLTLAADDPHPLANQTVQITATLTNAGTGPLCGAGVTVTLPPSLSLNAPARDGLDNDGSGGADDAGEATLAVNSPVTFSLAENDCLAAGAVRRFLVSAVAANNISSDPAFVTAKVEPYLALPGQTRVSATGDGFDNNGDGRVDEEGDDVTSLTLTPRAPRIVFTKEASVAGGTLPPRAGDTVEYAITVRNDGSALLRGAVVSDPLPLTNADYVTGSATTTSGSVVVNAGALSANLGDVLPATSVVVRVRVRIRSPIVTLTPLSNQASLTSADAYGNRVTDDPSTAELDDATVTPLARNTVCNSDADCLLAQFCDLTAHLCRADRAHGDTCLGGRSGAECNCDPARNGRCASRDVCDVADLRCGLHNGAPCASAEDCRSFVCNTDGRCGEPNGAACTAPGTCRSGICNASGRCGGAAGATCSSPGQCEGNVCGANGRCGAPNAATCQGAATCQTGVCGADGRCGLTLGEACTGASSCRSGACSGGVCASRCSADGDCLSSQYCDLQNSACVSKRTAGAACDTAVHGSAQCEGGVCAADGRCGREVGGACSAPAACRSGACIDGLCAARCSADTQCAAGRYCSTATGTCLDALATGASCVSPGSSTRQCAQGVCGSDGRCGLSSGQPCTSAAICQSGTCTVDQVCGTSCTNDFQCLISQFCLPGSTGVGRCTADLPNGSTCDRAEQCQSGACGPDGVCGEPTSTPCALTPTAAGACRLGVCDPTDLRCGGAPGASCEDDRTCRQGPCVGGDKRCGRLGGDRCTAAGECRAGVCESGRCGLDEGRPCTSPSACLSGTCRAGHCTLTCSTDADCETRSFCSDAGICRSAQERGQPCTTARAARQCDTGVCGTDGRCGLADGEPCRTGNTCRSGSCAAGVCGRTCTNDEHCPTANYCDEALRNCQPTLQTGTTCARDRQCVSGRCVAGVCGSALGDACTSAAACRSGVCSAQGVCGSSCTSDNDCPAGRSCEGSSCVLDRQQGGVCVRDTQCRSQHCDADGRCEAQNGAACGASLLCRTGACFAADNTCGLPNGQSCMTTDQCRSANCFRDGRCGLPANEACTADAACRGGFCDPVARRCGFPMATECFADAQCQSGTCGADGRCGLSNGAPCAAAGSCRTGVCDADGACGTPSGGACTTGSTCRSGACVSGRCSNGCVDDAQCISGAWCDAGTGACVLARPNGASCDPVVHGGRQCKSGACGPDGICGKQDGATCAPDASACRSGRCAGELCASRCTEDSGCATDRFCNVATGECVPQLAAGATCDAAGASTRQCRGARCAPDGRCGLEDGQRCTAAAQCRGGVCDAGNLCRSTGCTSDAECGLGRYCDTTTGGPSRCTAGRTKGDSCTVGSQCQSGICGSDRRCGAPQGAACSLDGGPLLCRSGTCDPDGRCGRAPGMFCVSDAECRGGPCVTLDGRCGRLTGDLCASDTECRSERCGSDGRCGVPNGGACTSASQCRAGACVARRCSAVCDSDAACAPGFFCAPTTRACTRALDAGEACDTVGHSGRDCLSSVCHSDNRCGLPEGAPCRTASTCRGGACAAGVCAQSCVVDANCPTGKRCDDSSRTCTAARSGGEACTRSGECLSDLCADGRCGLPPGGACRTADECREGICATTTGTCAERCSRDGDCAAARYCDPQSGQCLADVQASGLCQRDAQCPSSHCDADGRCEEPARAACGVDVQLCRVGVCSLVDGVCGLANGEPCADANACRAGICAADGRCGVPAGASCANAVSCRGDRCVGGVCQSCASDADCAAGRLCDVVVGECSVKRPDGQACTRGVDCASGQCSESGVCYSGLIAPDERLSGFGCTAGGGGAATSMALLALLATLLSRGRGARRD